MTKINIALADDELLFLQGLKAILGNEDRINVLFDAKDGDDLIHQLREAKIVPDIVVTDLKMPGLNGVEVTKIIHKEFPGIKVIALTSYFSKPFILNMISIGAVAYLAKNSTPTLMIKTIEEVYDNGFYYDGKVMQYVHESITNPKDKKTKSTFDSNYFTKREIEVLNLICKQYTTNDIGEKLFISPRTVEGHRNNLLLKTESKNVAGLVIYALKNKLVSLDNTSF
ncbi:MULTISPECIES: response regulator transcription factor [Bizionia]|uniref:Response regulator transcription factor n=1 Tax=Bizionia algoritergicola TaxID=291187 RepID=A0A5D0R1N0_9FLAO|nr:MULTISPECIES: response regulator transcription factor [Bizionia]OBX17532.1 DNA-binding response regulator [Bizionia sp. APA-3]TYB74796.1 response regulator transcription factor [Bizionia algoritergicola]